MARTICVLALIAAPLLACAGGISEATQVYEVEAHDPLAFMQSYLEMRDCRHSHEHDLRYIRVFASASAQLPYAILNASAPYPVDAHIVKLEYDDADCQNVLGMTSMRKLERGRNPSGYDWNWQKLTAAGEVLEEGAPQRCLFCHKHHCAPPWGFDLTCAEEL